MATKKTLKTYEKAVSTAKSKWNKSHTTYTKDKKTSDGLVAKYKKATGTAKTKLKSKVTAAQRATSKAKTRMDSDKTKYTKAKKNLATFKSNQSAEKRKATLALKKKMITQMQKNKPGYWKAKRPYIIPKYPGTMHSYVFIDNTSESETTTTDITTNALSPGQYVNHYTQTTPPQRQFDGKLGGSSISEVAGLKKQLDMLKRWAANGTEVEQHHGQRSTNSATITSVAANFDAPRDNAVPISLALQDVKWASSDVKKSSGSTTTKKKPNDTGEKSTTKGDRKTTKPKAGSYLTIKKGDTYWGYHLKFGTSIAKLRSWNGFPDTKLPVGKKIRVK
ncbi:LysM peptidoglycan-binding domain-containing protein [Secundilactobacillus muriivasis]